MPGLLAAIARLLLTLGAMLEAAGTPSSAPLTIYDSFRMTQVEKYDDLIADACETRKVDPFLLKGLLQHESGRTPGPINPDTGAAGIAQFTAGGRSAVTNLHRMRGQPAFTIKQALDPKQAIPAAAELMAFLVGPYCGSLERALAAYNTGKCRSYVPTFTYGVWRLANRYRTQSAMPPMPPPKLKRLKPKKTLLPVS